MTSTHSGAIEPKKLDLVMRDTDFVIYYDHQPLETPKGFEIAHRDSRLLKHILVKLTLAGQIDHHSINSFSIFSFCTDFIEQESDPLIERFDELIANDLLLKAKFNPGQHNKIFDLKQVLDYIEENSQMVNLMFWGVSVIMKGFKDFFSAMPDFKVIEKDFTQHREEVVQFIRLSYQNLTCEKKAVVNLLSTCHNNGILLAMMLVDSKISPSEYSLTTIAAHTNSFNTNSESISVSANESNLKPVIIDWQKPEESFRIFHNQALKATEFLGFFEKSEKKISVISELISQGEHDKLEFKSTFRWDLRQNKKNPAIEHAALKSITAFLNSDGGDLLIGVADDGAILGVEGDNFVNDDKFLLHVWTLIKTSMGQDISPYIKTTLEKFDEKTVCRVHCLRSPKPVFLRQNGFDEMFYIRIGPSTGNLDISEALKYIAEHF
jgi:hypothetical protein